MELKTIGTWVTGETPLFTDMLYDQDVVYAVYEKSSETIIYIGESSGTVKSRILCKHKHMLGKSDQSKTNSGKQTGKRWRDLVPFGTELIIRACRAPQIELLGKSVSARNSLEQALIQIHNPVLNTEGGNK